MDDKDIVNVGKYIDDLFNAFHAQYGDVREKALAVINEREARICAEAVEAERAHSASIAIDRVLTAVGNLRPTERDNWDKLEATIRSAIKEAHRG